MCELLITKNSIATIYAGRNNIWKIAFGECKKKVLPGRYTDVISAITASRRMGFGGYRTLPLNYRLITKVQKSLKSILATKVNWKNKPIMFVGDKDWRDIYYRNRKRIPFT